MNQSNVTRTVQGWNGAAMRTAAQPTSRKPVKRKAKLVADDRPEYLKDHHRLRRGTVIPDLTYLQEENLNAAQACHSLMEELAKRNRFPKFGIYRRLVSSGDQVALLEHLLWWMQPTKEGNQRMKVRSRDGGWWISRTEKELECNLGMSRQSVRTAVATLIKSGYLDKRIGGWRCGKSTWMRLDCLKLLNDLYAVKRKLFA